MNDETSKARSVLFRGEAFDYHFRERESRGVLNTSLRHRWAILLASIVLPGLALTYARVTPVEVAYRAEGTMSLEHLQGAPGGERLGVAYIHGIPDLKIKPGARIRLELLRPLPGRSHFIDGRLTALTRAPLRLEIALDQSPQEQVTAGEGAPIPVRIHAPGCLQSLWRLALRPSSSCPER